MWSGVWWSKIRCFCFKVPFCNILSFQHFLCTVSLCFPSDWEGRRKSQNSESIWKTYTLILIFFFTQTQILPTISAGGGHLKLSDWHPLWLEEIWWNRYSPSTQLGSISPKACHSLLCSLVCPEGLVERLIVLFSSDKPRFTPWPWNSLWIVWIFTLSSAK